MLVWDEEVEISGDAIETGTDPVMSSPQPSLSRMPTPRRTRSRSSSDFPSLPPIKRRASDEPGFPRPVPFAAKFQRVHPGTTGVAILEHLERLDAVEASLRRLGKDRVDFAEAGSTERRPSTQAASMAHIAASSCSPPASPLATVHEFSNELSSSGSSIAEEDLIALSKSTPVLERQRHNLEGELLRGLEWMNDQGTKQKVIVEVRVEVNSSIC